MHGRDEMSQWQANVRSIVELATDANEGCKMSFTMEKPLECLP